MAAREILLLGNEKLYQVSKEIAKNELEKAKQIIQDLKDTIADFRKTYGFARAMAAPQIDEPYRIIYFADRDQSIAMINPRLEFTDEVMMEVWDDCMSFPGLEVRVLRYKHCKLYYKNMNWEDCVLDLNDDLSELIQHEYDHLDGILAVQRAVDLKAFRINKNKQ